MIISIDLKNFRRHESLHLDLNRGLNVLRGANESGKTTVLESVLYALYGAKALRTPLSEAVTWGRKESELSVKLAIVVKGVTYTFTRSKAGAEATYIGGKVTGQVEVSSFASDLLGADVKVASMLMMSSQSGLRGALDDGPSAVSALMGKLADFDLIDRLVQAAQERLLLGSDASIKAKLDAAAAKLVELREAAPSETVWRALQDSYDETHAKLAALVASFETGAFPRFQQAEAALTAATNQNKAREELERDVARHRTDLGEERRLLEAARASYTQVPAEDLERARRQVASVEADKAARQAFEAVNALVYPDVFWDRDKASFEAEVQSHALTINDCQVQAGRVSGEISALEQQVVKDGKCPTCGHESANDEHVKEHNDRIATEIGRLQAEAARLAQVAASAKENHSALLAVQRVAMPFERAADRYGAMPAVKVDQSTYPPRVDWVGPEPTLSNPAEAQAELNRLQVKHEAAMRQEGQITVHVRRLEKLEALLVESQKKLETVSAIDLKPLSDAYIAASALYSEQSEQIAGLQAAQSNFALQRDEAKRQYEASQQAIAQMETTVTELNRDLKIIAFNNTLVKKLKALKPSITDSLWNTVLAAVSNFFSTLRGETSVVTKDASGFRVNGQSAESLSGSTLDVLALAIRVALTKTFIPHASFIVLDEPASGCDLNRTSNLLGFLASVGFEQTLLASHDELSEAVAEMVIALE